jgi:hypothetical protein
MLGAAVSNVPEVHVAPTALGLGAFALGAVGFGLGILLAKRPQKGLPVPGGETSASLVGELQVLPQGIAAIHGGSVGRYLAFTVVGTALIAGLALRTTGALPNRVEDGMSITPTVTLTGEKATKKGGKRDTKDRGANGDKSDKKRLDPARLLAPGARDALRKRLNVPTAPAPEGNTP